MSDRSSFWQMFLKIGFLKSLATFTEKHQCWSLFLIILLKWESNAVVFLWILQNLRKSFLKKGFLWLLLIRLYTLFYKQHFYKGEAKLKLAKNEANAKQHPKAEFLLFENDSHSWSKLKSKNDRAHSKE